MESEIKCSVHSNKNALAICTIKDCPMKFLCMSCSLKHIEHLKRVCVLEDINEDDSLIRITEKKHGDYLEEIQKKIDFPKEALEESLRIIEEYFEKILNVTIEYYRQFIENIKNYFNKEEFQLNKCNIILEELQKINFNEKSLENIIENIQKIEDEIELKISNLQKYFNKNHFYLSKSKDYDEIMNKITLILQNISFSQIGKKEFIYSGNDYDQNGLFYWCGTDKNIEVWKNPINSKYLNISASSYDGGNIDRITGNCVKNFHTSNTPNSWVKIELLKGMKFTPSHYTMGYRTDKHANCPENWNFEGSDDGEKWEILRKHTNDKNLNFENKSHTYRIYNNYNSYSQFRIHQYGKNSNNYDFLFCSGIEIYGELIYI